MKMKRKTIILLAIGTLMLIGLSVWLWNPWNPARFTRRGVAHQLPYKWDSYVRPDLQFTLEPMTSVVAKVNAVIRDVSSNAVPEAIKLDTTPTEIVKVGSNSSLDPYMDQLIAHFREHEKEMNRRGAEGFEGARFTGTLDGHHSLWCTLVGPGNGGLHWEAKEDALHASRMPRMMECRPYHIADDLFVRMNQQRAKNRYKVGAEPIVSALIYETDIYSWSIMLPDGPNGWRSEFRYDKVFKYVPDLKVILAVTTPEEHAKAEKKLKASGLWIEPETKDKGHNQASEATSEPAPGAASSSPQG